jgi:hypothetical protein
MLAPLYAAQVSRPVRILRCVKKEKEKKQYSIMFQPKRLGMDAHCSLYIEN